MPSLLRAPFAGGLAVALCFTACGTSDNGGQATPDAGNGTGGDGSVGGGTGGTGGRTSAGGALSGGTRGDGGGRSSGGDSNGGTSSGGSANAGGTGGSKVAPPGDWVDVTADLATQAQGGGDISIVAAVPGSAQVIVGIGKKGFYATDDSGETWVHLGEGAGSAVIDHGPTAIVFDPEHPGTFWESGIYGSTGGIFKTTNGGTTFQRLGDISHNDLVTVDFSDPERKTLLAGAHETSRKLFLSRNGGQSWTDIGSKLPEDSNFSSAPQIIDTQTFLLGSCGYGSGACGIFRSTNGGDSWNRVTDQGAVNRPLVTSKHELFWSVIYDRGVVRSTNGETWAATAGGPVQQMSGPLTELPDGRIVALGKTSLLVTTDGSTWAAIGQPLPFPGANCGIYGFAYSAATKTFFLNRNDCSGNVAKSAVFRAGFDYAKK